jgi:RNA polymerase sigma-70 factor (ECF subfamily)
MLGPGACAADLEDLTQQVFLAAHQSKERFRGDASPKTWLLGIAAQTVLMFLRSWRRRRRLATAAQADLDLVWHTEVCGADDAVLQRQRLLLVWRALNRVKPKKRIVFIMHEIEGMSGKDIAQALSIPEKTVWTRLYHARLELARGLPPAEVRR